MPMYWTFTWFLGCIYTVYYIVYIVFLVLNWLSNLEFWLPKKEDQVAWIGVRGEGLGYWGNARKKTFFFQFFLGISNQHEVHSWRNFDLPWPPLQVCTGVPHGVLHVLCWNRLLGGTLGPLKLVLALFRPFWATFKAKTHFLQNGPFPLVDLAEILCVDSQTPSICGSKGW